jgi:peroxiredoxin family protein
MSRAASTLPNQTLRAEGGTSASRDGGWSPPSVSPVSVMTVEQMRALVKAEVEAQYASRLDALEAKIKELETRTVGNRVTIVCFSGDFDKVFGALVIATGAAAMGYEVSMFHTFWGLSALKKGRKLDGKSFLEKGVALMTPSNIGELHPSKMRFAGAGAKVFRKMMKDKNIDSPEVMFSLARELGVRFVACSMSMDVMGIREDEILDGIEIGGVATYLGDAADSKVTLFI